MVVYYELGVRLPLATAISTGKSAQGNVGAHYYEPRAQHGYCTRSNRKPWMVCLPSLPYIARKPKTTCRATLNTGPGARPFVVLFSQLATLVIYEQGMMRPPNQEHFSSVGFKAWNMSTLTPKARTMDERRAVLSLWFLTSM